MRSGRTTLAAMALAAAVCAAAPAAAQASLGVLAIIEISERFGAAQPA